MLTISDREFAAFQRFIFDAAGITMSSAKKALVCSRLAKRLHERRLASYAEYYELLTSGADPSEVQTAIDLLTTNETYFFREPKHFAWLRRRLETLPRNSREPFRVWSAACSTGEEPFSIAMLLSDVIPTQPWELIASDLSSRVLRSAERAKFPLSRTQQIPGEYLQRFCLKGTEQEEGTLLIRRSLRDRVKFMQVNLNATLPPLGAFDVIFLRNVMIYFSLETKRQVVERLTEMLKPGGCLLIGHSESLYDVSDLLDQAAPAIYVKPAG